MSDRTEGRTLSDDELKQIVAIVRSKFAPKWSTYRSLAAEVLALRERLAAADARANYIAGIALEALETCMNHMAQGECVGQSFHNEKVANATMALRSLSQLRPEPAASGDPPRAKPLMKVVTWTVARDIVTDKPLWVGKFMNGDTDRFEVGQPLVAHPEAFVGTTIEHYEEEPDIRPTLEHIRKLIERHKVEPAASGGQEEKP